ncbi:SixA phosphatase family protein [Sphaerimonospora thailandensis]|uniref:SixA phosphatase family protein n=1 Tax=Sphaerimonospora thailandensis TaxID=795644 RepID=UPI001EF3534B|nr:histidine phosphatase family protein [Sphaerimonospora thailandensis]
MRTLVVVRHAEAGHVPGLPDRERPLTEGGEHDAREAGELIGRLNPELVVCSPAVRTRRTAELLDLDAPVEIEREIYEAYPEELLELLCRTDPDVHTLVLVGHNPGVHQLVLGLTGTAGDGFPPGAVAVVRLPGSWAEAGFGTGSLVEMCQPRRFLGKST